MASQVIKDIVLKDQRNSPGTTTYSPPIEDRTTTCSPICPKVQEKFLPQKEPQKASNHLPRCSESNDHEIPPRQLSHLVKGIKKEKAKSTDTPNGKARKTKTGRKENKVRKNTNAGRISTKTKKLKTISGNNKVLNKEETTFPTLNASNNFGKKVRNEFSSLLANVNHLPPGKEIKPRDMDMKVLKHIAEGLIKWKPKVCKDETMNIQPDVPAWSIKYSLVMFGKYNMILEGYMIVSKKLGELFSCEFASLHTNSVFGIHSKRKIMIILPLVIEYCTENMEDKGKTWKNEERVLMKYLYGSKTISTVVHV
nr:hypothetical protein [Tanacetum cinerariifolium]